MKTLLYITLALLFMSSCATSKETLSVRDELKKEKLLAEQALIEKAVESRRFIIKLDKIYFTYGGIADLIPRSNYIIIDGRKAIISAAYLGRQFDFRPIAGINMRGEAIEYELTSNTSKGLYEIKMKVDNKTNSFDVYLRIGKNGSCSASLSSMKIDNVRYQGYIVPIKDKEIAPDQNSTLI
jgi:sensor domain CHASE-containing protein